MSGLSGLFRRPRSSIPAIGVRRASPTLGGPTAAAPGGGLAVPGPPLAEAAAEAGWYQFTAVPGAAGNAVIVGHVDTYAGPAVSTTLPAAPRRPGLRDRREAPGGASTSPPSASCPSGFPVNQVFGTRKSQRCGLSRAAAISTTRPDITWTISSYRRHWTRPGSRRKKIVMSRSPGKSC